MSFASVPSILPAICIALTLCSAVYSAEPAQATLTVDGSAFVLQMSDGRVLRGTELEGATVYLAIGNNAAAPLKLASISADEDHPDILHHEFLVPDSHGGWTLACGPNADGERWGFPVVLPNGHPGRENPITLTCVSGAVGKCARFGYQPWAQGANGESLMPLHAACVRMVRADYCGDGLAHTKDGTTIDMYDDRGVQRRATGDDTRFVFEAGWTGNGAVCVHHTRWPDLLTHAELLTQCPALAAVAVCDEATARERGAVLYNTSQLMPAVVDAAPRQSGRDQQAGAGL